MLITGLAGTGVLAVERERLQRPQVSGVCLFARNFASRAQLTELVAELRELRPDDGFVICADQEGGPVQRFRDGFTRLPALARLGDLYDRDPAAARALAEEHAWVMASELRAVDVDVSLAPVVDLRRGNRAIGARALHADPEVVADLGQAYVRGMHTAGMAATLKHFPGHGSVVADTHVDVARDDRDRRTLLDSDLQPFAECIGLGVEAVMMAHVVYPAVDTRPAGQSPVWIGEWLRGELGFAGLVLSDDVSMAAAAAAGGVAARVNAHLDAGCDLVLACQADAFEAAVAAVDGRQPCDPERVARLRGEVASDWARLSDNPQRDGFVARVVALDSEEERR